MSSLQQKKAPRPKELRGETMRVKTGCGNLYVTVNYNKDKPFEVFAVLGKAGGCSICQNEAMARLISLALRYDIPKEEIVKELKELRCPLPVRYPAEEEIFSCPDAISKVLESSREVECKTCEQKISQ